MWNKNSVISFKLLDDHFTVLVEPGLAFHRLDGLVLHLPALLLLLLSLVCHPFHQLNERLHVGFNLSHVLIEVVDHF